MNKPFVESLDKTSGHQPLLTGLPQTRGLRAGKVYLTPGQDCGRHSTDSNEEILIFLSGQGQAVIGDRKTLKVRKGKIFYIPPKTIHNIINTSDEPLCYIYCVAPVNNSFGKAYPEQNECACSEQPKLSETEPSRRAQESRGK